MLYVSESSEHLDASPLVCSLWLHQPYVLLTVLRRHPLLAAVALSDLLEPVGKTVEGILLLVAEGHQEGCGRCVENAITSCLRIFVVLVVILEGAHKSRLGADAPQDLKVVVDQRHIRSVESLLYLFIALKIKQL